ncbi:MAG: hypothetical protein ACI89L_001227 [Phycisphaerales bacterium]|jgi:hypothetical protein
MKKLRRKLLIAITAVVVLLLVVVVGLLVFIDSAARQTITRGGTYATMADTSVARANVSLLGGRMSLTDFAIGNPEGYDKTPYFMRMDDTEVAVENGTLFADTVEIPTLTINGVELYLDKTHSPGNYNQNLARFEDKEKPAATEGGKKVVIRRIEINDITVHVAGIPLVQQLAGDVAFEVNRITLTDVGEGGGLTVAQVFGLVIKAIIASVFQAGDGILPGNVLTEIGHGLGELAWFGVQGVGVVFDVGEGAVNLVGDAVGSVLGGIGDLITGGDDEDEKNNEDKDGG